MKKYIKLTSVLLICILMLCSISACSGNKYALMIGDVKITPEQYKTVAISIKSQFLSSNGLEDTSDLWTKPISTTDTTLAKDYVDAMVQSYFIEYTLYSIHFDELGLKIDQSTEDKIQKSLKELVAQYGSIEEINKTLEPQGFSYEQYKEQFYNEAKKNEVILHYFGSQSKINPTSYEDLELYYNEYYTKVKHIFFSTKDSSQNDYSNSKKEEIGKKAKSVYDRIMAGEDYDKLLEEFNEDPKMALSPNGYIFSTEDTSYTKAFHNAAFDMKFGEVRLVQSKDGFHIMKRYPFMTEEITDRETEVTLLENMMSSEVSEILEGLREKIGIKYNNTVLTNLSVANIKLTTNQPQTDPLTEITNQFKTEEE